MTRRLEWVALALVTSIYLVLATLYVVRTPDWQAPDEPAHVNYIRQIADEHKLPVIAMGDWQQNYQDQLTATGFDPALLDRLDTVQYEDHQPPLYYLLQAPIYALTDGNLHALRLVSVVLGAGVVLCAWAVIRLVFPQWPAVALAGAGFVAFLPQHLSILASVNNDALAELIAGLTLLAVVRYLDSRRSGEQFDPLALGVLAGVAMITKTTIYFLGGIVALAVLLRWRRERWPLRRAGRELGAVVLPVLLMGGLWWGRNIAVYGGVDVFGLQRHNAVTVGQLRTGDYIEVVLGGSERQYLENMVTTTFHSFWGQFGWMAIPMPANVYRLFLLFTLAVLAGVVLFARRQGGPRSLSDPQRDALVIFAAVIVFVGLAYLLYNRDFVQFQGRYLYPALIPIALLVGIGLSGWVALFDDRIPALRWLPVLVMFGLAAFAWYALDVYIVPNLPAW